MAAMIAYEHPFSERIRTLLRLEELFKRFEQYANGAEAMAHHIALTTLFEILEVAARADLKSDLLLELERQRQMLRAFRDNPGVSNEALSEILKDIEAATRALQNAPAKLGQPLRENEWLMNVRSRSVIPGCSFQVDLPYYYAWLNGDSSQRSADIYAWAQQFRPLHDCLRIVLHLLRSSAQRSQQTSHNASYQMQLAGTAIHLAQVHLDEARGAVPEFSANKYMLWIRFGRLDGDFRTRPVAEPVDFELSLCNL